MWSPKEKTVKLSLEALLATGFAVMCLTISFCVFAYFSKPVYRPSFVNQDNDFLIERKARMNQYKLYQRWFLEEQELKPKYQFGSKERKGSERERGK